MPAVSSLSGVFAVMGHAGTASSHSGVRAKMSPPSVAESTVTTTVSAIPAPRPKRTQAARENPTPAKPVSTHNPPIAPI